jgi:hypothetical protein
MKRIKIKGSQHILPSRVDTHNNSIVPNVVSAAGKVCSLPAKISFDGNKQLMQPFLDSFSSLANHTFKSDQSNLPCLLQEGDGVLFEGKHFHLVADDHFSRRTSLDLALPSRLSMKPVDEGRFLSGKRRFSLTLSSPQRDSYILKKC